MSKPFCLGLVLACCLVFLSSCKEGEKPKELDPAKGTVTSDSLAAKKSHKEVYLHVEGMKEKLNIT